MLGTAPSSKRRRESIHVIQKVTRDVLLPIYVELGGFEPRADSRFGGARRVEDHTEVHARALTL